MYFLIYFFFNDTATTEIYTLSLHDALPISSWRHGSNDQHHAWGGRLWRRRFRTLWRGGLRDPRGLHRGADGRANARVPGKKNRMLRRKNGHAFDPYYDVCDPRLLCGFRGAAIWHLQHLQFRAARAFPGPLRLYLDGRQQWLRLRRP